MRHALGVTVIALLLVSCREGRNADYKTTIRVGMEANGEGLALTHPARASVKEADLHCGKNIVPLIPDASGEITVSADIIDCKVVLKSFVFPDDPENNVYSWSSNYTDEIGIFLGMRNGVADQILVQQTRQVSESCMLADGCNFQSFEITYRYSELKSFEVKIQNDVSISDVSLDVLLEPAPSCKVSAKFVYESSYQPNPYYLGTVSPRLRISLSECWNTYQAGQEIEYALYGYDSRLDYQIDTFHRMIDSQGRRSFSLPSLSISLSLDEIHGLTEQSGVFTANKRNLILSIRNKGGISIAYYIIESSY